MVTFLQACQNVRYALELKPFFPDFDNIKKILFELKNGTILTIEEKEILKPIADKIELYKKDFNHLFDPPNSLPEDDKLLIVEVLGALIQKYDDSNYDLQTIQAISNSLQKELLLTTKGTDLEIIVREALFPLVRWGMRDPYTFTDRSLLKKLITVVRLPLGMRSEGALAAWVCLGHEIGGHHFLSIFEDKRLQNKLYGQITKVIKEKIKLKIKSRDLGDEVALNFLVNYWTNCSLELTCDVLGMRHLGPAFAIGFAGYLQGVSDVFEASEVIYANDAQPKQLLELAFPKLGTVLISDYHATIQLPSLKGIFGKQANLSKSERGVDDIHFTKKRVISKGHPLDILRLSAMRKIVQKNAESSDNEVALKVLNYLLEKFSKENKFIDFVEKGVNEERRHQMSTELALDSVVDAAECVEEALIGWFQEMGVDSSKLIQWNALDTKVVEFIKKELINQEQKDIPHFPSNLFPNIDANSLIIRHIVAASIMLSVEEPALPVSRQLIFNKMKRWVLDANKIVLNGVQGSKLTE